MLRLEATAARDAFADVVNKVAYGDDRIVIARQIGRASCRERV